MTFVCHRNIRSNITKKNMITQIVQLQARGKFD